jgi:hypothetical protein
MAIKTGNLQRAIIEKLDSYPRIPILQNKLLWDLALDRDEIKKTGNAYGRHNQIEEGTRKKSFEINFRRAIKELAKREKILLSTRTLYKLSEIIDLMPYLTDRLEVFTLRSLLLPTIKKYLVEEDASIQYRDLDPYGFQIEKLKTDDRQLFNQLENKWKEIESQIVKILQYTDSASFDSWIELLLWGRSNFRTAKRKYPFYFKITQKKRLSRLPEANNTYERNTITDVKALIGQVESQVTFKVGEAKKVLYALFSASKFGKTSLTDDFREYLFKQNKELLKSLPGDKDSHVRATGLVAGHADYMLRQFSPLLDQLFTRHIFRELSFVNTIKN